MFNMIYRRDIQKDKSMYAILLTACIDPGGMVLTKLTDPVVRKSQYVEALEFYLRNTDYPIVFTENSGNDVSDLFPDEIRSGRLEVLTFEGNKEKTKGKGYGECEIIEYALDHSRIIRERREREDDDRLKVIKITGRLIVENVGALTKSHVPFQSHEDLIGRLDSRDFIALSEVFIASCPLLRKLVESKWMLNDSKGFWFERLLARVTISNQFRYFPFVVKPAIRGSSGSLGKTYVIRKQTLRDRLEYKNLAYYNLSLYYQKLAPGITSSFHRGIHRFKSLIYMAVFRMLSYRKGQSSIGANDCIKE